MSDDKEKINPRDLSGKSSGGKEKQRVPLEEMDIEPIDIGGGDGRNNDPRRQRLLSRLRSGPPPTPQAIGRGMQRKIDFAEEQFRKHGEKQDRGPVGQVPKQDEAPKRRPPSPPDPLALPKDATEAVLAIRQASVGSQDSLRHAAEQLYGIKEDFVALQKDRTEGKQGAGEKMTRMTEGVRGVLDQAEVEMLRLQALRDQLAQIQPDAPNAPPALAPLHQKVTGEIAIRLQQGQTVIDGGLVLVDKLQSACDGKTVFKPSDAMPDAYKPAAGELPSMLRELTGRLNELTPAFEDATRQLDKLLGEVTGLFAIAVKGGKLPESTPKRIDEIAQGTEAIAKPFSGWNKGTINPYRGIALLIKDQPQPLDPEVADLQWRMNAAYDEYGRAFGEAGQAQQKIAHLIAQLRLTIAPPTTGEAAAKELASLRDKIEMMAGGKGIEGTLDKPLKRLADKKQDLGQRKRLPDPSGINEIKPLQERLVEVNRDVESVVDSRLSLLQAQQQLAMTMTLLGTRFANQKPLAQQVAALRKAIEQLGKRVGPVVTDSERTEAGFRALADGLNKRLDRIGPAAPVEETTRLAGALASLPPPKGKDTLFPPNGAATAKNGLETGGDPRGGKLFDAMVKAWAAVEKKADEKTLAALEKAASACISFTTTNKLEDPIDTGRADKCREALRRVHELQLETARGNMPPPPWSEDQAREGRRIEAQTMLYNGGQARPPSGKGDSDSFFLNNSSGKPAFIFKPQQGEKVAQGGREGQGVAREVMSSKFNEQMKQMVGVDFGVCPTGVARLDSQSFDQGTLSQETSRLGALQQTAPNEGNLTELCGNDPNAFKQIPTEDVQKIAMLDFLTLQGDRNPENLLVRDEGGKKRLVPIDGGYAFPDKTAFGQYCGGMGAGAGGEKTGKVGEGNGLMQLPQSDEKFTPEMLKAIERIDPTAMVKGMKQANTELVSDAPELDGMIGDENLENMRRSALFLKKAAPEFTVAELAQAYAMDFKRILALPANKVEAEIAKVLETMRARGEFNKDVRAKKKTYQELGGDAELTKLGWKPGDAMLSQDWNRKIEILRKRTPAPQDDTVEVGKAPPVPPEQRDQKYKELGGDKVLLKVLQRPDGTYSPPITPESPVVMKLGRLQAWQLFQDNGGDAGFAQLVELYERNRYTLFDDLAGEAKAAVVTFAHVNYDPFSAKLGVKGTLLATFAANKRRV